MDRLNVLFADENGLLGNPDKCGRLVVYDMVSGEKTIVGNPLLQGRSVMEDFIEENDPSVIIVSEISDETEYFFEENGVKVVRRKKTRIDELIGSLFVKG